ncbi:MAG: STAS domain-containing protein [Candidatus Krumholzibacteria bacterium]|nr:STAS domain-containing protein [Candidatus Krumholzibacteria bacterium]
MPGRVLVVTIIPRVYACTLEMGYWGDSEKETTTSAPEEGGVLVRERIRDEMKKGVTRFLIDLARVQWLSSTWIGWLVAWHRLAEKEGGRLAFAGLTEGVHRVLDATRASGTLPAFDTVSKALDHIQNQNS